MRITSKFWVNIKKRPCQKQGLFNQTKNTNLIIMKCLSRQLVLDIRIKSGFGFYCVFRKWLTNNMQPVI